MSKGKIESVFIEVIFPRKSNILVGCIYRHPCMPISEFNELHLTDLLDKVTSENKTIFLLGDFNIDLIKNESDSNVSEYFNHLSSNHLLPHISIPTRITDRSKTLIDNIFSNSTAENLSGNLTTSISDHLPQFVILPLSEKLSKPEKNNTYKRNFKNINKDQLLHDFSAINWQNTLNLDRNDSNYSFNAFFENVNNRILDKHAPFRKISNRNFKRQQKPWITRGILTSIKKRNNLFSKFKEAKSNIVKSRLQQLIKKYRNSIVALTRLSKKNHFTKFFLDNSKNLRQTWNGIKSLLNINSKSSFFPSCISKGEKTITNKNEIAEEFNCFFTSIASKLQDKIHHFHTDFNKYLKTPSINSMFVQPTDENEIFLLISRMESKKAAGPNSIPVDILKLLNGKISPILASLFNLSFQHGVFPDILKISSVIPVFKKGSKLECNNYRPISLISNISKLIEKLMYSRLYSFLELNKSISDLQFGFRTNHSTSHALLSLTERIREALDTGNFACGVFIDLQKAFDSVDLDILVKKLNYYGIRGIPCNWFNSYLQNRKQFVTINGFKSSLKNIKYGVPQGSVLGPLLFLIFINDLKASVKNSTVHHFADDTNLLYTNKSLRTLSKKINYDLRGINDWLNANRISLNSDKTEYILFSHPNKAKTEEFVIKINGKRLHHSSYVKYVGVLIDEHLSFKHHINALCLKLRRANGMLAKIRHFVDGKTLKSLYFSLFNSHLSYCSQIWGQKDNSVLTNKLKSLQRIAIRIINFAPFHSETSHLFRNMNLLNFSNSMRLKNCLFVYDFLKSNLPESFNTFFNRNNEIHSHFTRNNDLKLYPAYFKTSRYGKDSIKYSCITTWNVNLPKLKNDSYLCYNCNILDLKRSQFKKLLTSLLISS